MPVNFDTFSKYSVAGPRYTSYPTALEFSEYFSYDSYVNRLKNADSNSPLSLYFHLPFCRSACYFCGCNVVFTSKQDKLERYIEYIKKEISILANFVDTSRVVHQMHFGGGTPTYFSASQLEEIISAVRSTFTNFADNAEISCEIDPRYLNEEQMQVLTANGFNRISFGVQDLDEKVQKAVHRIQSLDINKNAVELARKYGIKSVNIDLIYGLPYQTFDGFKKTLKQIRTLNPDRLAVFNYAHVPWLMKTMRKIDETTLPIASEKLKILRYTIDYLSDEGYKMIGMDHFAKPEDELFLAIEKNQLHRNFQGYTTKGGADLIGIGLTSIGEGSDYYAQNFKEMSAYEEAIDAGKLPFTRGVELGSDDLLRKAVIMQLMSNFKLDIRAIESEFNIVFSEYFSDALKSLEQYVEDGLVKITPDFIEANATGAMLIRNISMAFDFYSKSHNAKKTFSKTI